MPIKPFALPTTTKPRLKSPSKMKASKQKPIAKAGKTPSSARPIKKSSESAPTKARHIVRKVVHDIEEEEEAEEEEEEAEEEEVSEDEDDDDEGVQDQPHGKRKRALIMFRSNPVFCFINPWFNVQGTLLHGFKIKGILESLTDEKEGDSEASQDEENEPAETPENFVGKSGYDCLTRFIFPEIEKHVRQLEELDTAGNDPLKRVFTILSEINTGSQSGHGDDTSKINENIIQLSMPDLTDDTLIPDIKKYHRGFNHPHTAHLLCPQRWLAKFDEDPQAMMLKLPTKVTPCYLPSFLYDPALVTDTDPCDGLFCGHACIRSFCAIYLGNGHHDATSLHSMVKKKLHLSNVSEHMVIYAAVQARFALSSCAKWGKESDDFGLERFSDKLYKIFQDSRKDGDDWADETLQFYIEQVLKPKNDTDNEEEIDEDDDESIMEHNRKKRLEDQAAAAATDEDANTSS
ncbi:uncharacterized protein ARMOST_14257 [Armillaria ostoyae]|uniref:Uncharacterized protein n=1 Tax=Armillaria ostoyae TaxID=47428 RepID=A0A284RQ00_ARMOS|nr:uncharacterized protein ARMOST_14257 [Armillaria ostoyae]